MEAEAPVTPEDHIWKSIALRGQIPPRGFFLIERERDTVVRDIRADLIVPAGDRNEFAFSWDGDLVVLVDAYGRQIDTANADNPHRDGWIAGSPELGFATMERLDPLSPDRDDNWRTNRGVIVRGLSAEGQVLLGTAAFPNEEYLLRQMGEMVPRLQPAQEPVEVTFRIPTWTRELPGLPWATVLRVADDHLSVVAGPHVPSRVLTASFVTDEVYMVSVDVSDLPAGDYLVCVTLGNGMFNAVRLLISSAP